MSPTPYKVQLSRL